MKACFSHKEYRTLARIQNSMTWVQRLKRVYKTDVETYRICGGSAKVIACIEDPVIIKKILMYMEDKLPARAALQLPDSRVPLQSSLFG